MENKCPHCGKTNRPNAKFCGFCGKDMHEEKLPTPQAAVAPPSATPAPPLGASAGTEDVSCPHCGQPVRAGGKFCVSCGKAIAAPATPSTQSQDLPEPPSPGGPPPVMPPPRAPQQAKFFPELRAQLKKMPLWVKVSTIVVMVVICVTLTVVIWKVRFGSESKPAPTFIDEAEANAEVVAVTDETKTPKPTREQQITAPTITPFPTTTIEQPGESPPSTATEEVEQPTAELTFTQTVENTPPPSVSFEDNFEGNLKAQWEVLPAVPEPTIDNGVLELRGDSFLSAKEPLELIPGVTIKFQAAVGMDANHILYLDWSPGQDVRSPDQLGPLHLAIGDGKISLYYRNRGCDLPMPAANFQTYRIEVLDAGEELGINLFVNDSRQDKCLGLSFPIPQDTVGRLSLSGYGGVDYLHFTIP